MAFAPVIDLASAYASLVTADEAPNFNKDIKVIYDPNVKKYADSSPKGEDQDPKGGAEIKNIPINAVHFPEIGELYGKVTCEKLGLNAPVYWGDTGEILRVGVGQSKYTFPPGFGRTIILSAHNISFFNPLKNAEAGDVIVFDTNYETYEYRVVKTEVAKASDLESTLNGMLLTEKETLVMYTCYPFDAVVAVPDRYVVYCEKISGLDVKWRY
ncbi:MAG: class D sortase [Clostridia bacterium]|nr:class D sortase [Clostridia bacterium]